MIGIHGFKGNLCAMKNPSIVLMTLLVAVCIPLGTLLPRAGTALPACPGWSVRAQVQAHFDWRTAAHLVEACQVARPRHNTQAVPA